MRALTLGMAVFLALAGPARAAETIRLGLLAFGTVQWEIDTMRAEGRDAAAGIRVEPVELAGKDGASVALLGGSVDAIVTDWPWVSRQRAMGRDLVFVPWSLMTGAVLVPADSPIRSLADLAGRRLGIAGGPLDKSWLLLRALASRPPGLDLDTAVEKTFGAPPLLSQQLTAGRLDALLTFWQAAVPLEAMGYRRLVDVAAIPAQLGVTHPVPLLGWVLRRDWAEAHRATVKAFLAAEAGTRRRLCAEGADWRRLDPLTKAADDATRDRFRRGFCAGIPTAWGEAERADATRIYAIMAGLGGPDLTGSSAELDPGTFWPEVRY